MIRVTEDTYFHKGLRKKLIDTLRSKGIKDEPETFIEPGLFVIKPNQELYCASLQTMPFARPGLDDIINAIKFVLNKDYPARGEA